MITPSTTSNSGTLTAPPPTAASATGTNRTTAAATNGSSSLMSSQKHHMQDLSYDESSSLPSIASTMTSPSPFTPSSATGSLVQTNIQRFQPPSLQSQSQSSQSSHSIQSHSQSQSSAERQKSTAAARDTSEVIQINKNKFEMKTSKGKVFGL